MDKKVGDVVTRYFAGAPMELKISKITPEIIECGDWRFDRKTGAEIDEFLGWGPGMTGSYIKLE